MQASEEQSAFKPEFLKLWMHSTRSSQKRKTASLEQKPKPIPTTISYWPANGKRRLEWLSSDYCLKLFNSDHFINEKYLASGTFGRIYKAIALLPYNRVQVAIKKVILVENGCANALKEAETLKHLDHPNIVAMHDIVTNRCHGELWIVMEYLNGGSLRGYCTGDKYLSHLEKLKISCDCWSALSYLHNEAKITHKDIKPENILVHMRQGKEIVAKVCDFGLATISDTLTQTQSTSVTGTAMYFPPEYVEAIRNAEKADVYSMGASLCELYSRSYFWCQTGTQVPLTYPQVIGKLLTIWRHVKKGTVDKLHVWTGISRIMGSSEGRIRKMLALVVSFERQRRPCAEAMRNNFMALLRKERAKSRGRNFLKLRTDFERCE